MAVVSYRPCQYRRRNIPSWAVHRHVDWATPRPHRRALPLRYAHERLGEAEFGALRCRPIARQIPWSFARRKLYYVTAIQVQVGGSSPLRLHRTRHMIRHDWAILTPRQLTMPSRLRPEAAWRSRSQVTLPTAHSCFR